MEDRHRWAVGRSREAAGPQAPHRLSGGAGRRLTEGSTAGSALALGARLPAGRAPGLEQAPELEALPVRRCGGRGCAGAMSGHSKEPRHVQACRQSWPAEDNGARGRSPKAYCPTSATSDALLRPATPTPSHFQHPLSPRQRKGAKVGIARRRKARPLVIFSS